ncbi:MAG TPA: monovalent cation/H(+) antiporter subunit G [Thermomicrobiales bacterium]|jgi:multicomponent Na+:H+ antiporter subunit G|nr:monovalent cation/H(+) antiporter subunit G [Thermomicrobiales bacterium]
MDLESLIPWIADGLVLIALLVMTVGAIGIVTMPDIYTKLHAASKAVFLGVILLALAAMLLQDMAFTLRAALICMALILTTPVASHVIGRAAYLEREHMTTPGAVDESGHHLADEDDAHPIPDDGLARREPPVILSDEPAR